MRVHSHIRFTHTVPAQNWTKLGGFVWLGLSVWVLALLATYGMLAGYAPDPARGIGVRLLPQHLTEADLHRLASGQPLLDASGETLIDPSLDRAVIFSLDDSGIWSTEDLTQIAGPARRVVVVIVLRQDVTYQQAILALDDLMSGELEGRSPSEIWLVAPSAGQDA